MMSWRNHVKMPFEEKEKIFDEFRAELVRRKVQYYEKETMLFRSITIVGTEKRVELAPHSYITREKNGTLEFWKGARYGYANSLEQLLKLLD